MLRSAGWQPSALPFLDAMVPARMLKSPVRLAFLYVPNGIMMKDRKPATEYEGGRTRAMKPLEDFRGDAYAQLENRPPSAVARCSMARAAMGVARGRISRVFR